MLRIFAVALIVATVLFGCSRPDRQGSVRSANSDQPVQGDWAVVRYESEPDTLNPILRTSALAGYVLTGANSSQIYEQLLGYNTTDWSLTEPILAENQPEISEDHLTYIF